MGPKTLILKKTAGASKLSAAEVFKNFVNNLCEGCTLFLLRKLIV